MKFFPDTNFFLQCRDAKDVDWSSVTDQPEVVLLVAREVQREIDRHKGGGNARRADRARRISTQFRSALESPDGTVCIRKDTPRVLLTLAPRPDPRSAPRPDLDPANADDRLVGEVLAHLESKPDDVVALLTNDVGPMATARAVGVTYSAIPDEWLLPPEPSATDRKVKELEKRLANIEKSGPLLTLELHGSAGVQVMKLEQELTYYPPLNELQLIQLLDLLDSHYPVQDDFSPPKSKAQPPTAIRSITDIPTRRSWQPPTDQEIQSYEDRHRTWRDQMKKAFTTHYAFLNEQETYATLTVMLGNVGSQPAENLLIDFECQGPLRLADPEEKSHGSGLVAPPQAPSGYYRSTSAIGQSLQEAARVIGSRYDHERLFRSSLPQLFEPPKPPKRDPHSFYYAKRHKVPAQSWRLECKEFRHKLKVESFDWRVTPERLQEGAVSGRIITTVSASNLAEPKIEAIPVRLLVRTGNTYREVANAIHPRRLKALEEKA